MFSSLKKNMEDIQSRQKKFKINGNLHVIRSMEDIQIKTKKSRGEAPAGSRAPRQNRKQLPISSETI
jgi:hypothetical protein